MWLVGIYVQLAAPFREPNMPAPLTFRNPHEAAKYIADKISTTSHDPPEVSLEVANGFLQCLSAEELLASDWPWDGVPRGPCGAASWAELTVRASDIELLKQVPTIGGSMVALLQTHTGGWPLLWVVLCALLRLRAKGFYPDPLQKRILIALRADGPMTLDQLICRLNLDADPEWTEREVREHLATLEKVHLNNGEAVAMVQFANGEWATEGRGLWEVPILADLSS